MIINRIIAIILTGFAIWKLAKDSSSVGWWFALAFSIVGIFKPSLFSNNSDDHHWVDDFGDDD